MVGNLWDGADDWQDTIEEEDIKFRAYLAEHGYDTSTLGSKEYQVEHVGERREYTGGEKA
jgi:hypothetical protein